MIRSHNAPIQKAERRAAFLWSLLALLLGFAAATALAMVHRSYLARDHDVFLSDLGHRTVAQVEQQLRLSGTLVRAFQAVFLASENVTPAEFELAYQSIRPQRDFPAVVAVGYSVRERDGDGERYITRMVAPLRGNERVIGLDVGWQPTNLQAVMSSRDSNEPAMSAPFRLVQLQADDEADGVVIRLPAYSKGALPESIEDRRQRIAGSIAASFRVGRLIGSIIGGEIAEHTVVRVDDTTAAQRLPLYVSSAEPAEGPDYGGDIRFGGRLWHVQVLRRSAVVADNALFPWLTLAAGALVSTLLALLVWTMQGTRYRAESLARDWSRQHRESEHRFRALNELMPALVLLLRASDGRVVYFNHAARARLGTTSMDDIALDTLIDDNAVRLRLARVAAGGAPLVNESVRLVTGGGLKFWVTLSVSLIELDHRPHLLAVANDISDLRELNERLAYQASHDELTNLYNRREFERRLASVIAQVDQGGSSAALMYADLDQFKLINDTSGHAAGDSLLADLSTVLRSQLRPGDIIARLGGDEFGVLMANATPESALETAERLRRSVDGFVFSCEGKTFTITTSIGVVMLQAPVPSLREVLAVADTACYLAKEKGRNRVHLNSERDLETALRRSEMEWVSRLREALAEDRFCLFYQILQPMQPAADAEGVHFELLLRLHDEGQWVQPGAFIPAAERFGLMPLIDRWVVQRAITEFNRLLPDGSPVALCAINLSGHTVDDEAFADFVIALLHQHQVPPHKLCFEITETAAISNMARVVRFIEKLRAVGCRFALDDFGAGMASFGYLKNLPVDILKIDGSFIQNMESDPLSLSIVRAVTDIGHQLHLQVIAEWVANEHVMDMLRGVGVDFAQGYAVHHPEPIAGDRMAPLV